VANIMHAARLLDHVNDPAVHQSINLLQHAALQLNDKEKMPYLSHNCTWSSRTPGGRRRRQEGGGQNNQEQQLAAPNQGAPPPPPAHSAAGGGGNDRTRPPPRGNYLCLQDAPSAELRNFAAAGYDARQIINARHEARAL
jgi:hypothetical protein